MAFPAIISPKTCPPKLSTKNFPPNILNLSTHSLDIWDSHSCRWSRFFNTLQFCLLWPSPLLPANWHVKYMTTCSRLQSIDCCYYEGLGQIPDSKYLFVFFHYFSRGSTHCFENQFHIWGQFCWLTRVAWRTQCCALEDVFGRNPRPHYVHTEPLRLKCPQMKKRSLRDVNYLI